MRTGRCGVLSLVFLLGLAAMGASPWNAEAVEYLGEYCWSFTNPAHGSGILKFGLVHLGGGHYLLSGGGGPPDRIEPMLGNAELRAGKVFLTTASSGANTSDTWTFGGHAILDAGTLNGTFDIMGVSHSKTNPDPENAHADYDGPFTITFISCP